MDKKVILESEEAGKIFRGLANLVQLVDEYCYKENRRLAQKNENRHIVDSDKCNPVIEQAYNLLLNMGEDLHGEIVNHLPKNYFESIIGRESVLADYFDVNS